MRRDAREHRDALIAAAESCFDESGYMVPLDAIAQRAGVGRATLYRNFKDRMALVLAVFERRMDELESLTDVPSDLEEAVAYYLERGALLTVQFHRLAADVPLDPRSLEGFRLIETRVNAFLRPFVEKAAAAGVIGPAVTPERLVLAARLISGLLFPHMTPDEARHQIRTGFALLMDGLRPR